MFRLTLSTWACYFFYLVWVWLTTVVGVARYSLASDPRSGLLAAGGQGGKVCLFRFRTAEGQGQGGGGGSSSGGDEGNPGESVRGQLSQRLLEGGEGNGPLLAFKPHGSTWVSDVAFCGGGALGSRLLTSANDGCVALWDLTKASAGRAAGGQPKALGGGKCAWHGAGIFSLACRGAGGTGGGFGGGECGGGGCVVATGSKDGSIALGTLGEGGDLPTRISLTELDLGQVKGVGLRPFFTGGFGDFGSGGDGGGGGGGGLERAVAAAACGSGDAVILDGRDPRRGQGLATLRGAHVAAGGGGGCTSVEWHPLRPHELLTAGLDAPVLRLWDVRMASSGGGGGGGGESGSGCGRRAPLREYRGHVPSSAGGKRLKAISRPRFLAPACFPLSASSWSSSASSSFSSPCLGASGVSCGGVRIAVQGEHCSKLTLYDAASGTVVSRGALESAATAIAPACGFAVGPSGLGGPGGCGAVTAGGARGSRGSLPCVAVAYDDGRIALLVPGDA